MIFDPELLAIGLPLVLSAFLFWIGALIIIAFAQAIRRAWLDRNNPHSWDDFNKPLFPDNRR